MPLHPQVREFLAMVAAQNAPLWHEMPPEDGRRIFAGLDGLFGEGPEVHSSDDHEITERVAVRIYKPAATTSLPALMYFHGGGWVLGDIETHDALCRRLSIESSCVVCSVDYRRAPEHPYPAAFDDCYAATKYVADHAAELGVDPNRIVVAGDSAGGNLAVAVALKARDVGGPPIRAQILVYPVIEPVFETSSYKDFGEGHGLTRETMKWFWQQYLGENHQHHGPYAVPTQIASLEGLPRAHVVTAEFDVLRDEGESFAARLRAAGVATTHRRYDGMIHGFIHFSAPFDVGRQAVSELAETVRLLAECQ